jgi:hypothetical protein
VPLTPPSLALPALFWPPHPLTNNDAAANAVTPASFNETEDTSDSFQDQFTRKGWST